MTGLTFMAARAKWQAPGAAARHRFRSYVAFGHRRHPEHPGEHLERAYTGRDRPKLGLTIEYFPDTDPPKSSPPPSPDDGGPAAGDLLFADGFAIQYPPEHHRFPMSRHAPVISGWPVFAKSGAPLHLRAPALTGPYRRLAYLRRPPSSDTSRPTFPIEQPTKFELVVNLAHGDGSGAHGSAIGCSCVPTR